MERDFGLGFAGERQRRGNRRALGQGGRRCLRTRSTEPPYASSNGPGCKSFGRISRPERSIRGGRRKAFEYLVIRMFELDKAQVTWPYPVYLFGGKAKEQIDGAVRFGGLHWLIESKDEDDKIAMDPIAKLRNQMLRRPWGTIGLVFTSTKFTPSAVQMTHFPLPQPLLLWTGAEVEYALGQKKICVFAQEKY